MKRHLVYVVLVSLATLCSSGSGQFLPSPGPLDTLSVTVTGTAEAPAAWAELALSIEGRGATAQEALATCDEAWKKTLAELAGLQIPEQNIRSGAPEIAPNGLAQVIQQVPGMEGDQGARQTVRRTVIVRLAQETDVGALYENVCRVIDVAADTGATIQSPGPVQAIYSAGIPLSFGVNDEGPLREQAIANGLALAKQVAEVTARSLGRNLSPVASVDVVELGRESYLGMVMGSALLGPKPGLAVYQVSLTVRFRLQ